MQAWKRAAAGSERAAGPTSSDVVRRRRPGGRGLRLNHDQVVGEHKTVEDGTVDVTGSGGNLPPKG